MCDARAVASLALVIRRTNYNAFASALFLARPIAGRSRWAWSHSGGGCKQMQACPPHGPDRGRHGQAAGQRQRAERPRRRPPSQPALSVRSLAKKPPAEAQGSAVDRVLGRIDTNQVYDGQSCEADDDADRSCRHDRLRRSQNSDELRIFAQRSAGDAVEDNNAIGRAIRLHSASLKRLHHDFELHRPASGRLVDEALLEAVAHHLPPACRADEPPLPGSASRR